MEKIDLDNIITKRYPHYFDMTSDEQYDFWHDLSEKEKYAINEEYLLENGNPEYDYLMCNEPGRLDTYVTIFDYPSMYEFDKDWWEFQRNSIWEEIEKSKREMEKGSKFYTPTSVAKSINNFNENYNEYAIYCSGDWFRMMDKGIFIYSQVISLKWFLFYEIEIYLDELQEANIPYEMNGDLDFTTLLNESNPSIRYKAGGREYEVEALTKLMSTYLNNDALTLIEKTIKDKSYSGLTFRRDKGYELDNFDPFTDFIFVDEESLKAVRMTNFLNDFEKAQLEFKYLDELLVEIKELVRIDFERIYEQNRSKFLSR